MKQRSSSKRGWLGVSIQDITAQMEKAMDLKSRDGALVNEVVKKSPAETAGIKEGDVIVQFAGKNIQDASDLQDYVAGTKPETKVQVVVVRKGEKKNLDVVVGKQSTPTQMIAVSPRGVGNIGWAFGSQNYDGMNLRELNEQLGQYFGVTEGNGVLVWEVEKGSAAEKAGVKAGDVVTMVGKKKIKNLRDVGRALGIYDEGEKAEIEVMRKGSKQTLSLEVQDEEEGRGFHYWYNAPSLPRHRGGVFFNDQSPFQIETPDIDIETLKPDMEKFRLDMDEMKNNLRKQTEELRQRIQRDVRRQVRISVDGSI
ncbi:MAG TPA: PDZ domain-containing protein [Bacteroidota bacterium]|nr:PDZ domain-containing protein [Bacteroidota bacterium]